MRAGAVRVLDLFEANDDEVERYGVYDVQLEGQARS